VFGIASYTYLSFRAVAPLIGAALFIIHIKEILKSKQTLLYLLLPGILVGGFLIRDLMSPTAAIRFSGTNFLSHSSELLEINEKEMAYDGTLGINIPRRILHDSLIYSGFQIISRAYLSHFSADFLLYGIGHKQESSIFKRTYVSLDATMYGIGAVCIVCDTTENDNRRRPFVDTDPAASCIHHMGCTPCDPHARPICRIGISCGTWTLCNSRLHKE
jgi:hypothetical protein